jgi:NADH-quinone oxidoreductase subunit L
MRNMGGLRSRMGTTFWVYLIGALALAGIAPLSGFFSKDEILVAASEYNPVIFILLILAAFLTAFYMWRQITMVFLGTSRTRAAGTASENGPVITVPLIILALLSAVGGALNLPGVLTLEHWLEHTVEIAHEAAFNPIIAGAALVVALLGLGLANRVYGRQPAARPGGADPLQTRAPGLFDWLANAWRVDGFYNRVIVGFYKGFSQFLATTVDQDLIDGIVNGFGTLSRVSAQWVRQMQSGFVRTYALAVVVGVVAILTYLALFPLP